MSGGWRLWLTAGEVSFEERRPQVFLRLHVRLSPPEQPVPFLEPKTMFLQTCDLLVSLSGQGCGEVFRLSSPQIRTLWGRYDNVFKEATVLLPVPRETLLAADEKTSRLNGAMLTLQVEAQGWATEHLAADLGSHPNATANASTQDDAEALERRAKKRRLAAAGTSMFCSVDVHLDTPAWNRLRREAKLDERWLIQIDLPQLQVPSPPAGEMSQGDAKKFNGLVEEVKKQLDKAREHFRHGRYNDAVKDTRIANEALRVSPGQSKGICDLELADADGHPHKLRAAAAEPLNNGFVAKQQGKSKPDKQRNDAFEALAKELYAIQCGAAHPQGAAAATGSSASTGTWSRAQAEFSYLTTLGLVGVYFETLTRLFS